MAKNNGIPYGPKQNFTPIPQKGVFTAAPSTPYISKNPTKTVATPDVYGDYGKNISTNVPYILPNLSHPLVQNKITNDPKLASILQKAALLGDNSLDSVLNSYSTTPGELNYGKPVTNSELDAEYQRQLTGIDPYYAAERSKETADLADTLGFKQREYQRYLQDSAAQFAIDKDTQDKTAADNGVLFSSGRLQKLNNLANQYSSDAAAKKDAYGTNVSQLARDYQYKYGNSAANNSALSSFYNAGGNTYNPNVAHGQVGSTGLSSIYNPNALNLEGTNVNQQQAIAKQRAASVLGNKSNKLLLNSYLTQY